MYAVVTGNPTLDASLVVNVKVTADGAADPSVIGNDADCPTAKLTAEGKPIAPLAAATTVTVAVTSPYEGRLLEWMTAVPADSAVTGMVAEYALAGTVTVAGTEATAGVPELMLKVNPPAGAGEDNVKVRFWLVPAPVIERADGVRFCAVPTTTEVEPPLKLYAIAVIVADPPAKPVTVTGRNGVVEPSGIMMVDGDTETFVGSLLVRMMKMPPGAG